MTMAWMTGIGIAVLVIGSLATWWYLARQRAKKQEEQDAGRGSLSFVVGMNAPVSALLKTISKRHSW